MEDALGKLYAALSAAQGEFPAIPLDKEVEVRTTTGATYRFRYATLAGILSVVRPVLAKHGLAVTQCLKEGHLVTMLCHAAGAHIESSMALAIKDGMKQQEIGSVLTYARRYSLSSILGVVGEDDDDGNAADGNTVKDKPEPAAKKQPPQPKPQPVMGEEPITGKCAGEVIALENKAATKNGKNVPYLMVTLLDNSGKTSKEHNVIIIDPELMDKVAKGDSWAFDWTLNNKGRQQVDPATAMKI